MTADTNDDPQAELSELRARVAELSAEPAPPPLIANATEQVKDYAHQAQEAVEQYRSRAARQVRERPLTSLLAGLAAGYLVGRIVR